MISIFVFLFCVFALGIAGYLYVQESIPYRLRAVIVVAAGIAVGAVATIAFTENVKHIVEKQK